MSEAPKTYGRYIRCPSCQEVFKWNHKANPARERVVDPTLPPEEKRKVYAKRFRDKNKQ